MARRRISAALVAFALAGAGSAASAQVLISEVFENPPGLRDVDLRWEYIELRGRPGMDLSGYAVILLKGGSDRQADGRPDEGLLPEIDEAFALDGLRLDQNGGFTLLNTDASGRSAIADRFMGINAAADPTRPDAPDNPYFERALSFPAAHIPSPEPCGALNNDGASTYLLVRRRPGHSLGPDGRSIYAPDYAFRKGTRHDVDFDGRVDRGDERPADGAPPPSVLEPYQMVDEVGWFRDGGHVYLRSAENHLHAHDEFNPDGVSRIRFLAANPAAGNRTVDLPALSGDDGERLHRFQVVPTTIADESFVWGTLDHAAFPDRRDYYDGFSLEGWYQIAAPTDPAGPRFDGSCDPEPDRAPFPAPCPPVRDGPYLFADLRLPGFGLTPGSANVGLRGGPPPDSVRFIPGDVNLDGALGPADVALALSLSGASPDDLIAATPEAPARYRWEGIPLQQLLAAIHADPADGDDGRDAPVVTARDVAAIRRLIT